MTFTHFHADWPGSPQRKQRGATRGWCLVDSFDGSWGAQHQVGCRFASDHLEISSDNWNDTWNDSDDNWRSYSMIYRDISYMINGYKWNDTYP